MSTMLSDLRDILKMYPGIGPVAQLGARFHGMEEVVTGLPLASAILFSSA